MSPLDYFSSIQLELTLTVALSPPDFSLSALITLEMSFSVLFGEFDWRIAVDID